MLLQHTLKLVYVGDGINLTNKENNKILGITATGAVLVHPDGFVAWRSYTGKIRSPELFEKVMAQILDKEPKKASLKAYKD